VEVDLLITGGQVADGTGAPLRQALAHCFDYEAIKKGIFSGHGTPTSTFLHPSSPYSVDLPLYAYDPELAKKMFEEEGLPADLPPLVIEVPAGWPELGQLAVIWQSGLAKAGVKADVRIAEIQVWLDRTLGPDFTVTTNAYGPSPDPNTWFQIIPRRHWYAYATKDKPGDYTTEAAKKMEQLVNEALAAPDEATRKAKWQEAIKLHYDELPAIPVFFWPIFMPVRAGVHDIMISPTSDYHYEKAWVE
jgi:peptide/nickel transport system substrate-binding protein